MSTDFATELTVMFDDVAASINPRGDFASTQTSAAVPITPSATGSATGGRPFRRWTAVAAAALLAIAGGAIVWATGDDTTDTLSTASETAIAPVIEPVEAIEVIDDAPLIEPDDPEAVPAIDDGEDAEVPTVVIARTATVTEADATAERIRVVVRGTAPASEAVLVSSLTAAAGTTADENGDWKVVLEFTVDGRPLERYEVMVSFGSGDGRIALVAEPKLPVEEPKVEEPKVEEPKVEEPKEQPQPTPTIEFTAQVSSTHFEMSPSKVVLSGNAQPGAQVTGTSDYGSATAVAAENGVWEMYLQLVEFGPGARTTVRLTAQQTSIVRELVVERPAAPAPVVEFSATFNEGVLTSSPMWQRYNGTGQPGSRVVASSDYGVADATVGESGTWTVKLWLEGAPADTNFGVYISNSESNAVKEFRVQTPAAEPTPPTVEFTASAALTESAASPPFNEYGGTAQPGTMILITSPYGNAERVAGEAGGWDARIEFPDAPLGETFVVKVKSVATGQVKEFPMKRVEPA